MSRISDERLREILDGCEGVTPGPWAAMQTVIHGKEYGGFWVETVDPDPEDERFTDRLICITGSGGARSYTSRVIERQIHDDSDVNAQFFARLDPQTVSALVSELMESREAKPVAYMDENGALLVPEGSPIKALWDNTPEPEVGKKLIPLYARNALKPKEPSNASD